VYVNVCFPVSTQFNQNGKEEMNNNNNNSSNKVKKKKARAKDIKIDGLLRSQGGVPARIKLGASSSAASKTRIVNPQHI